jgi:hypothetical protein
MNDRLWNIFYMAWRDRKVLMEYVGNVMQRKTSSVECCVVAELHSLLFSIDYHIYVCDI